MLTGKQTKFAVVLSGVVALAGMSGCCSRRADASKIDAMTAAASRAEAAANKAEMAANKAADAASRAGASADRAEAVFRKTTHK